MTIVSDIFLAARGAQDQELIEGFDVLTNNLQTKKILDVIESFKNKIPKDINESKKIDELLNKKKFELFNTGKNIIQNDLDIISRNNLDKNNKNPITLFKKIYKRHTNFVKNIKHVYPDGVPEYGKIATFKIKPKELNGDLLNGMVLQLTTSRLEFYGIGDQALDRGKYVNKIGLAMLEEVNLYFGETLVDSINGEIINLINETNLNNDSFHSYNNLIGHTKICIINNIIQEPRLILVPLPFWFTRHIYNALPLSAMNAYNSNSNCIKLEIKFRDFDKLVHKSNTNNNLKYKTNSNIVENCKLLLETITMNNEEKKLMSSIEHKYLITQFKKKRIILDSSKTSFSVDINFGNDLKELLWIGRRSDSMKTTTEINAKNIPQYNNHFDYVSTPEEGYNMFSNFSIYEKSNLILDNFDPQFFNMYLPYKHHKKPPSTGIYIYNYAEKPNEEQPSGSYSGTHDLTLKGNLNDNTYGQLYIIVYGVCYNILTINSKDGEGQAQLKVGYNYKNNFD